MRAKLAVALLGPVAVLCLAQDAAPAKRIKVGGQVQQALAVARPAPIYPPMAKQARIQGVVRLEATISPEGRVTNLKVISGHPLLVQAALDAVRQWAYKPTVLNGEAVEVITTIDVNFTLDRQLAPEEVERAEQLLRNSPEDLATRSRLVEHYAAVSLTEARREHVLWLIEHHPEDALLSVPWGMLLPAGFKFADPAGYEQAKRLWLNHTARTSDARVIRHAALFLAVADKDLAETVLLNAQTMQPTASEWPSLLGKLYAEAILGLSVDPAGGATFKTLDRQSPLAQRARTELDSSTNVTLLRSAIATLDRFGAEQLASDAQLTALVGRIRERVPPPHVRYGVAVPVPK